MLTWTLRRRAIHWWTTWAGPVLVVVYLVLAILLVLRRHAAFHTYLFDLGYYTQVIWNTAHGRWFATSLKPPTFLADHFSPVLALLAPLFWLAPDARMLLVIGVVALGTAILPAFIHIRTRYPTLAPFLALAFVFNPLLHQAANQEFHEIMLAVPTLALAVYALHTKRDRLLLAVLALTLLIREDMALYVASFGLYFLGRRPGQRWYGVFLIVASAAWLLVLTGWVIPTLGGGAYRHASLFTPLGNSIPEIILALVRDPLNLIQPILTVTKAKVLLYLFIPLAGLALLVPGEQLLWVPGLLLLLISPDPTVGTLQGWYVAPLIPLLWASVGLAITRLRPRLASLSMGLLLIMTFAGFLAWSPFPGGGRFDRTVYTITEHDRTGHYILANVPADVSLATQNKMGAHLGTRQQLYLFPWFDQETPPEIILLDAADINPYPLTPSELQSALVQLQMAPEVETIWEQDGYFVFKVATVPVPQQGPWVWASQLQLEGYALAQADETGAFVSQENRLVGGRTLRVALYWKALAPMSSNYSISVRLLAPDGYLVAQNDSWPAQGALATSVWPVGRTIRDTHYLSMPPAPLPETLALEILVYETETLQLLPPVSGYILITLPVTQTSSTRCRSRVQDSSRGLCERQVRW